MQFRKVIFLLSMVACAVLCASVYAANVDNGDGTITDTCADFMWQKSSPEPGTFRPWKYCADLSLGGHSDWRLPTARELAIILDSGSYAGSAGKPANPADAKPVNYLSSTFLPSGYAVLFYSGGGHSAKEREAADISVRCVRDLN